MCSEREYLNSLRHVLEMGKVYSDRTGVGTRAVFGEHLRINLREKFPLLTTKKVNFDAVVAELDWFLSGSTNVNDLDSKIWDEWADADGELGPIYGHQWRSWDCQVDQISNLIKSLKSDPHSRRHIITAWNPTDVPQCNLPPCHVMAQWHVNINNELSCQVYQRSADMFLGLPFNIASYALLTHMLAHVCGYGVGQLIMVLGDAHIYSNHVDQVRAQLERTPRDAPTLLLPAGLSESNFSPRGSKVLGYDPHPALPAPIAI